MVMLARLKRHRYQAAVRGVDYVNRRPIVGRWKGLLVDNVARQCGGVLPGGVEVCQVGAFAVVIEAMAVANVKVEPRHDAGIDRRRD